MLIMHSMVSLITIMICGLLSMAFFTLLERKILAYIHLRKGPNKVGKMGILQPISDAMKLFTKSITFPSMSNSLPFFFAPMFALTLSVMMWGIYPYDLNPVMLKYSLIIFLIISSLSVYPTLMAGWVSNSKYAMIGSMRSSAQTVSYEISMVFILLSPIILQKTFSMLKYSQFTTIFIMMIPLLLLWIISLLAESNRTPFDLAEGESELVSGFNTEYSSGPFAMIFMAEYASILIISMFTGFIFFNSAYLNSSYKILLTVVMTLIAIVFIIARGTFPRLRYDQLMKMTWKGFLPFSLLILLFYSTMAFTTLFVSFSSIELLIQSSLRHK